MISFRDSEIEAIAALRGGEDRSPSMVARTDLERYYALLQDAEAELNFDVDELNCIYDVFNGTWFEATSAEPGLRFGLEDAFTLTPGYAEKWGVDGKALIAKVRELSPLQSWALVTKIERFWSRQ